MATTNVNIQMDSELEKKFNDFCTEVGMTMTTAINIFASKVVREYRIPFEIGIETPNAETIAALEEGDRLINDPNVKRYDSVEALFEELDKE